MTLSFLITRSGPGNGPFSSLAARGADKAAAPIRLSVTGRQTRITVERVPCSLDGSRAAITRFLPSWIAARFTRVVRNHKPRVSRIRFGLQDARGPYFCAPHHALQKPCGRLSDRFRNFLLSLSSHGEEQTTGAKACRTQTKGISYQ